MASSVAQALIARPVNTLQIDPMTNRVVYPQAAPRPGFGPPQGTKSFRGDYPDPMNSLGEPWPGAYDQSLAPTGRVQDRFTVASNPPSEFSQGYVQTMGAPGANQGTGPQMATDAERAIAEILVQGGTPQGSAFGNGWGSNGFGYMKPLQYEAVAPAGPAPKGDPWAGARVSPAVLGQATTPGLVTGNRVPGAGGGASALHAQLSGRTPAQSVRLAQQTLAQLGHTDTGTPAQTGTQGATGLNDKQWTKYVNLLNTDPARASRFRNSRIKK